MTWYSARLANVFVISTTQLIYRINKIAAKLRRGRVLMEM